MADKLQIALLEDHPVFRAGLKMSVQPIGDVVLEAGLAQSFIDQMPGKTIDVAILDLILPDLSGFEVARHIKAVSPTTKVLIFSIDIREETVTRLAELGVEGFISKRADSAQLCEAIQCVMDGNKYFVRAETVLERDVLISQQPVFAKQLTRREYDVMVAFCQGRTSKEIAAQLYISPYTVENHKRHIFSKLGIHNVVELVNYAIRNRIFTMG